MDRNTTNLGSVLLGGAGGIGGVPRGGASILVRNETDAALQHQPRNDGVVTAVETETPFFASAVAEARVVVAAVDVVRERMLLVLRWQ